MVTAQKSSVNWKPQHRTDCPGGEACRCPQVLAYNSDADIIGYGGAAGGGKSDLALGFAGTKHTRSIIFRREFPRLEALIARSREIFNSGSDRLHDRFNESLHRWELSGGQTVRFAGMEHEDDKFNFQGRPFDLYVFDEGTEFSESQIRFVTAWNRTTKPGQKCRVVIPFNPPMKESGEWVVQFFGPWLDPQHPRPAKDGELRWFVMLQGVETEWPNGDLFTIGEETFKPKSRTFFHASLRDNPILYETGYQSQIDALPEPLRSQLRGSFEAGKVANPWQVIPAEWAKAAQARWKANYKGPVSFVGGDVSRGGDDQTAVAPLRGVHFDELSVYPGKSVLDGDAAAGLIIIALGDGAIACVDVVGIGASAYDSLRRSKHPTIGVNFGEGAYLVGQRGERIPITDRSEKLTFANVRAAAYWMLREALDPTYGAVVELPPDPKLLSDLCAPKWKLSGGRILVEPKEDIVKRLGRSPDRADAVVLAWWGKFIFAAALAAKLSAPQVMYNPVKIGDW